MANITTRSDYLKFKNEDLQYCIPDDDQPNGKVERFIERVESQINELLLNYYEEQEINDSNREYYKKGVMYTIEVILEKGLMEVTDIPELAYRAFKSGGFCNVRRY